MSKGRLTALSSVVLLVALTLGAAALSLRTSPPAEPPPLTQLTATAALRYVVANTETGGFTVSMPGVVRMVYGAPLRCEFIYPNGARLMDIGTDEYTQAVGGQTWRRSTLGSVWDSQCDGVTTFLAPLLYSTEVERSGDRQVVHVKPTVVNSIQVSGTWLVNLVVRGDKIEQEVVTNETPKPALALPVHQAPVLSIYYAFGTSSVLATPANDVTTG
jgi:hypothetical protein